MNCNEWYCLLNSYTGGGIALEDLLNLFGMLSDTTRMRILLLLLNNELCVCEIFAALDMSQPRVSRQLAILKQARIIKDRRDGKWIYYKIDENAYSGYMIKILEQIPEWLKDDIVYKNDKAMLKKISKLKNKLIGCGCMIKEGVKVGK